MYGNMVLSLFLAVTVAVLPFWSICLINTKWLITGTQRSLKAEQKLTVLCHGNTWTFDWVALSYSQYRQVAMCTKCVLSSVHCSKFISIL